MYDDDPVSVYLSTIGTVPPLTPAREAECVRRLRGGDQGWDVAEKDLVESVLPLVVEIAKKHPSDRLHILDLIQIGNQALFTAIRAFADSDSQHFAVYAEPFIEDAIRHALTIPDC
jgi:DNA-directed RNA polymerase sigma subunit (sigma70/sigma32)